MVLPEVELVGLAAGAMTTLCWLPQAVKIIKTKDTHAIALPTQAIFALGCLLWMIYGLAVGSLSIIVFNFVTAGLAGMITLLKLRYG